MRRNGTAEWSLHFSAEPPPVRGAELALSGRRSPPVGVTVASSTLLGGVGGFVGGRGGAALVLAAVVVAIVPLLILAVRAIWAPPNEIPLIALRVVSVPWVRTGTENAALLTAAMSAVVIWFVVEHRLDGPIQAGLLAVFCFSTALALHVASVNLRIRAVLRRPDVLWRARARVGAGAVTVYRPDSRAGEPAEFMMAIGAVIGVEPEQHPDTRWAQEEDAFLLGGSVAPGWYFVVTSHVVVAPAGRGRCSDAAPPAGDYQDFLEARMGMSEPGLDTDLGRPENRGLVRPNRWVAIVGIWLAAVVPAAGPFMNPGGAEWFGPRMPWWVVGVLVVAVVELIWRSDFRASFRWNDGGFASVTGTTSERASWRDVAFIEVRPGYIHIDLPDHRVAFRFDSPGWLRRVSKRAAAFPGELESALRRTRQAALEQPPDIDPPLIVVDSRPWWLYLAGGLALAGPLAAQFVVPAIIG